MIESLMRSVKAVYGECSEMYYKAKIYTECDFIRDEEKCRTLIRLIKEAQDRAICASGWLFYAVGDTVADA